MTTKNTLVFTLNLENYSLEAVYQAAYALLDRAYFYFDKTGAGRLKVELSAKESARGTSLAALRGEFLNELLNSELRVLIAKRTRKVREALIAQALIGASSDSGDIVEDPLGIAMPWEEKYGASEKTLKVKAKNR